VDVAGEALLFCVHLDRTRNVKVKRSICASSRAATWTA
jgi:hypothetical protein